MIDTIGRYSESGMLIRDGGMKVDEVGGFSKSAGKIYKKGARN